MGTRLQGKTALVTGAGRGIGKAIALRLAADGANVVINYRSDPESAQAVVDEITDGGRRAIAIRADVSDPQQVVELFTQARRFARLDIVCSNAGIEHFGPLEAITAEDFDRVFHTNTRGQLLIAQQAAAVLNKGGVIVLTSSVSAVIGVYQHTLYAASKAAVDAMVLQLAVELGMKGIRINAIAPGGTNTDMAAAVGHKYMHPAVVDKLSVSEYMASTTAVGRLAEPEEIASAVSFLVSDDASYFTGKTLHIDGGKI
ncbi:dehydrogenase/ketoreductase [Mycobacteroides abscessus 5S-0422]|uniref:17beta-hydroxysteroid dehydrogenase n=2 Tax=Mycobacteroides abscessus TaxID=36809 RepID=X8E2X3_9MYCO|nr:dehydrogenase/ketoreductase [Mycobacteroides abscessus 5S-0422]EIU22180.1 dehydrogenase/ketoreductase [Mycobacteroides abscessus 5S-0708]EIU29165.1 dehydrogenase/ketoreductase [Mycobacteroides abscessus 5S-1212]EUA74190.1 17beta-hydroxysteroid dehydrogenase [Mycobacteroides abscessus subsp. bolletii 1513]CPU55313.1 oxidoreductase yjgI [Mycobacteroides abscessus]SIN52439.1 oxidoreductase yjgI [Mycobacteroides abscessus subsp. abscessus]SKM48150.1 oxidoreductase yjgI [Mycobacteroides abscess